MDLNSNSVLIGRETLRKLSLQRGHARAARRGPSTSGGERFQEKTALLPPWSWPSSFQTIRKRISAGCVTVAGNLGPLHATTAGTLLSRRHGTFSTTDQLTRPTALKTLSSLQVQVTSRWPVCVSLTWQRRYIETLTGLGEPLNTKKRRRGRGGGVRNGS